MNIIKKLVVKNLKLNKKRSVGTVIGIMLSVALICAVAGMFACLRAGMIEYAKKTSGEYHFYYNNIDEDKLETLKRNRSIEKMAVGGVVGDCIVQQGDKIVLSVMSSEGNGIPIYVVEGRAPENENEIVLTDYALEVTGKEIGDTITLDLGNLVHGNIHEEGADIKIVDSKAYEFLIVGKLNDNQFVGIQDDYQVCSGYTINAKTRDYCAYIRFKKPRDYKKLIVDITGEDYESILFESSNEVNLELLMWETMEFSDDTMKMLYAVVTVLVVIIVITSVFCIKNSFDISITEKMKTYGMLASVGSTKKQIRKSVLYEGMYLGGMGIPLGIAAGELAVFILCQIVSFLLKDAMMTSDTTKSFAIPFVVPWLPIVLAVVLGIVTIYLSVFISAFKAGRVSPIVNIRGNNEIKIKGRKLKVPKLISKIFGIGGIIAYKNLKRSKRKYRTTIISIAVSVFVFIAMSTYIAEMKRQALSKFTDFDYNMTLCVSATDFGEAKEELSKGVLKKADRVYYVDDLFGNMQFLPDNKVILYDDCENDKNFLDTDDSYNYFDLFVMENDTFESYADKAGIKAKKDECIIVDYFNYRSTESKKVKKVRRTDYKKGDVIEGVLPGYFISDDAQDEYYSFQVGGYTDVMPYGHEMEIVFHPIVIISEALMETDPKLKDKSHHMDICIETADVNGMEELVEDNDFVYDYTNIDKLVRANRSILLLIGIFMYGFITVISLIGVTNIFNTITSNMELRQKEFAMLKSIGMTSREFRRMLNLETLFYCVNALFFGVASGLLGSWLMHNSFNERIEDSFIFPGKAIAISVIFVFVLVYIIIRYSIGKINKQNTIETIRKDTV